MTAEVAVINTRGVALAADSAVTIGGGEKVYNTSSKMARLSDVQPVGIMTYGNASFVGFNWDLVFSEYRKVNGDLELDCIADYGRDFLEFLACERRMFPSDVRQQWMTARVHARLRETLETYRRMLGGMEAQGAKRAQIEHTAEMFMSSSSALRDTSALRVCGRGSVAQMEESMVDSVEAAARAVVRESPQVMKWPAVTLDRLVDIATNALSGETGFDAGLVLAGYGRDDMFPGIIEFRPIFVSDDTVLYTQGVEDLLSHENTGGWIYPFAQQEVVDAFIGGIDVSHYLDGPYNFELDDVSDSINIPAMTAEMLNELASDLIGAADERLSAEQKEKMERLASAKVGSMMERYGKKLDHARQMYRAPVIAAVDALTKEGLAEIAEELVNLTSLRRKFALGLETVGGPVDVAVITRSDGFIWVKRKEYYEPALNRHREASELAFRTPRRKDS